MDYQIQRRWISKNYRREKRFVSLEDLRMLQEVVLHNMAKYYKNCNDNTAERSVNMFLTTYQTTGKTIMIRSDAAFSPDFYHLGIKQKDLVLLPDERFHQELVSNLGYDATGVSSMTRTAGRILMLRIALKKNYITIDDLDDIQTIYQRKLSRNQKEEIQKEVDEIINQVNKEVKAILENNKELHDLLLINLKTFCYLKGMVLDSILEDFKRDENICLNKKANAE